MDDLREHHAGSQVRWAEARAGEPHSRTRQRIAAILIGAVIGYAVGAAFVLLFDRARYSGDSSNLVVWLVGLPTLLAIGGAVIGSLAAAWPTVEQVDAPIRERRFAREGRAATSEQGQLPGSPVPPNYEDPRSQAPDA
jgi:hypothetical protein